MEYISGDMSILSLPRERNSASMLRRELYKSKLCVRESFSCVFVKGGRLVGFEIIANHQTVFAKDKISECNCFVEIRMSCVVECAICAPVLRVHPPHPLVVLPGGDIHRALEDAGEHAEVRHLAVAQEHRVEVADGRDIIWPRQDVSRQMTNPLRRARHPCEFAQCDSAECYDAPWPAL